MGTIGLMTARKAGEMLTRHLTNHYHQIDQAYLKADDSLDVALKVKFSRDGSAVNIETSINFVSDRVKDKMKATVDEKQLQMFTDKNTTAELQGSGKPLVEILKDAVENTGGLELENDK